MDGPNVNGKVFKDFSANLDKQNSHQLVKTGFCGFHVIHNKFKNGVQNLDCDISVLLRSVYFPIQEFPARRADFYSITKRKSLPLQFSGHRWLENLAAAERFLSIGPQIKNYIHACKSGKASEPLCQSNRLIHDFISDNLILAKLQCFIYVANEQVPKRESQNFVMSFTAF
ncbi:peptidase m20 domain-containing protein 2 [Plakobranchus ocellatus]|uniref:Peptidase m20 domain-containing protein 2 n=1 Tax=Plakobranchus ocellatus TaxID=259542 RepID=A0AAV4DF35_9GAST|nr:peptidase m20 domain-containing protein 2 [Plakobranchus ocellatus]